MLGQSSVLDVSGTEELSSVMSSRSSVAFSTSLFDVSIIMEITAKSTLGNIVWSKLILDCVLSVIVIHLFLEQFKKLNFYHFE